MNLTLSAAPTHTPVLLEEAIEALNVQPGGRYIDGTIGPGGHAAAILERSAPGGQLLGIDADPQAIKMAQSPGSKPTATRCSWSTRTSPISGQSA